MLDAQINYILCAYIFGVQDYDVEGLGFCCFFQAVYTPTQPTSSALRGISMDLLKWNENRKKKLFSFCFFFVFLFSLSVRHKKGSECVRAKERGGPRHKEES